jgi:hypothetical protein
MSSGSFTSLTTSSNCILGSSSTNTHQLNGSLTIYNNGLTLNNSNITQTGSSQTNTIAGTTTFNNSVTLNGGITNNIITIGQLTISYGYKQGALTANYLQFDLPGVQTWYIWDNVECALNLLVSGIATLNGMSNNGTTNFYNTISLLNAAKNNLNYIKLNNGTNAFCFQQIDNGSNNYLRVGRDGQNDITIAGSNGAVTINTPLTINNSLTFNSLINTGSSSFLSVINLISSTFTNANNIVFNNGTNAYNIQQVDNASQNYLRIGRYANSDLVINSDGSTSINNNLFLAQVNGVYSLYFGTIGSQIGRLFATASQMYFDFYNNFTFRYVSSLNGSSGLNLVFNINNSGISTNGSVTANIMNSAIGYALSYSTIPSSYYSNYNLIGSQQVFFANTTNIVSQSPSFTAPITNVLIITIGTGPTNLQPGIYNLQSSWIYWNSNSSNTMTFQWISFGISSTASTGNITVNDMLNEYKQETRTIPTNASSLQTLDFALKYSTNLTINTNDFSSNVICFNVFAQYIGATGCQMIGTGQAATKFIFTRIG